VTFVGFWEWDGWNALVALGTLALAIVTVAVAVISVLALRQTRLDITTAENRAEGEARLARQATEAQVFVTLLDQHRSQELLHARNWIRNELPSSRELPEGLRSLAREDRDKVELVLFFYDFLGMLVAHDLVDLEPVAGWVGGSIARNWQLLEDLVRIERCRRGHPWQMYFENLAALVKEPAPEEARLNAPHWVLHA
jgi:hypothetical protein